MGTAYTLYEKETITQSVEVLLNEASNELCLHIFSSDVISNKYADTEFLPPKEMLELLMEGIKSVSYWMSEKEFNEVFSKLETYPY